MKISYHQTTQRFIVSNCGEILHTPGDIDAATRLAGIEPDIVPKRSQLDAAEPEDDDLNDLFDSLSCD